MIRDERIFATILVVVVVLIASVVYFGTPNHSRTGKIAFVGLMPVMIKHETEKIWPYRFVTVVSQNAMGQLYEIELPVEAVSDVPVMKGNP